MFRYALMVGVVVGGTYVWALNHTPVDTPPIQTQSGLVVTQPETYVWPHRTGFGLQAGESTVSKVQNAYNEDLQ
jgi:hypothetical protein